MNIVSMSDLNKTAKELEFKGYTLPFTKARNFIHFKNSEITIWTGRSGHGKSMFLSYLMLGFIQQGAKVCIATLESSADMTLNRMMKQASGKRNPETNEIKAIFDYLDNKLWLYDKGFSVNIDRMLDKFKEAHALGVNVFVIDSLVRLGINENDSEAHSDLMNKLIDFKQMFNCQFHLVVHTKKSNRKNAPGVGDISGTEALVNMADKFLSIWSNKDTVEDPDDAPAYIRITCYKDRNGEGEGSVGFFFDKESLQYLAYQAQEPVNMVEFSNMD